MKKSNIISAVISIVLVAAISVGATLAYLTSTSDAKGSFNIGDVKFTVDQANLNRDLAATTFMPLATPQTMTFTDLVTMDSTSQPAYLRIKVAMDQPLTWEFKTLTVNSPWKLDYNDYGRTGNGVIYIEYDGIATYADFTTGKLPPIELSVTLPITFTGKGSYDPKIEMSAEAIQAEGFNNQTDAFVELKKVIAANPNP